MKQAKGIVSVMATEKMKFSQNIYSYFIYSMMAGACCALGMALAYSVGGQFYFSEGLYGAYTLVMGIAFVLSFTLIIFCGAELFTGNMVVMTVGVCEKTVFSREAVRLLAFCYLGNVLGAILFGAIFGWTGLLSGYTGDLLVRSCTMKMALPFAPAFFRGILCNMLICMGIWAVAKLKSEVAKMLILIWVVVGFVASGYEHSIANTALFTMAFIAPQTTTEISLYGAISNLIPVTLGNMVGGSLFVGLVYWYSEKGMRS